LAVLDEMPLSEAISWTALIFTVIVAPLAASLILLRRHGKYAYQRQVRVPIYIIAWTSVLLCLVLTLGLHAPTVLVACMAALALWIPLQFAVNTWVTKVSIHTAVVTGCVLGLLLLGDLPSPLHKGVAVGVVLISAWARMVTRHHTFEQVLLGILVGALPVLVIFPQLLRG